MVARLERSTLHAQGQERLRRNDNHSPETTSICYTIYRHHGALLGLRRSENDLVICDSYNRLSPSNLPRHNKTMIKTLRVDHEAHTSVTYM